MDVIAENPRGTTSAQIDSECRRIPANRLASMSLLLHQRAAIYQIWHQESQYAANGRRCVVYGDKLGSGKTRVALGLAILAPRPPVIVPERYADRMATCVATARNRRYLPQNLFIVRGDVLRAWQDEIEATLPYTSVLYIGNAAEYAMYIRSWQRSPYELIVVKNGTMQHGGQLQSIIDRLASEVTWPYARVIIDDYEQTPRTVSLPLALSYLAISTTSRRLVPGHTAIDYSTPWLMRTTVDEFATIPTICCADEFRNESFVIPGILCRRHTMPTPHRLAMNFGQIEHMREIVEALAADAHDKVAKLLGVSVRTPADIYRAIMGKMYDRQSKAKSALGRLDAISADMVAAVRAGAEVQQMDPSWESRLRGAIHGAAAATQFPPLRGFSAFSKALHSELEDELRQATIEVNNVRQSLSEQSCEVCHGQVGGELNAIIVRCCSKMACSSCYQQTWARWKKTICPFNARHTLKTDDIVHISGKVNLAEVAEAEVDSATPLFDAGPPTPVPTVVAAAPDFPKVDALLAIIRGEAIGEPCDLEFAGLMTGGPIMPANGRRKVIVFASEAETLEHIGGVFTRERIGYNILSGTANEIHRLIHIFRDDDYQSALLICSHHHVSGFNVQFATDLVFYNRIRDRALSSQAAGRIQRIGRQCSATIWQLLYDDE